MLKVIYTTYFKKTYKKSLKQGKKGGKINDIICKLANNLPLDVKHKDHKLSGNYINKRECHIEPDWLLIYEKTSDSLVL